MEYYQQPLRKTSIYSQLQGDPQAKSSIEINEFDDNYNGYCSNKLSSSMNQQCNNNDQNFGNQKTESCKQQIPSNHQYRFGRILYGKNLRNTISLEGRLIEEPKISYLTNASTSLSSNFQPKSMKNAYVSLEPPKKQKNSKKGSLMKHTFVQVEKVYGGLNSKCHKMQIQSQASTKAQTEKRSREEVEKWQSKILSEGARGYENEMNNIVKKYMNNSQDQENRYTTKMIDNEYIKNKNDIINILNSNCSSQIASTSLSDHRCTSAKTIEQDPSNCEVNKRDIEILNWSNDGDLNEKCKFDVNLSHIQLNNQQQQQQKKQQQQSFLINQNSSKQPLFSQNELKYINSIRNNKIVTQSQESKLSQSNPITNSNTSHNNYNNHATFNSSTKSILSQNNQYPDVHISCRVSLNNRYRNYEDNDTTAATVGTGPSGATTNCNKQNASILNDTQDQLKSDQNVNLFGRKKDSNNNNNNNDLLSNDNNIGIDLKRGRQLVDMSADNPKISIMTAKSMSLGEDLGALKKRSRNHSTISHNENSMHTSYSAHSPSIIPLNPNQIPRQIIKRKKVIANTQKSCQVTSSASDQSKVIILQQDSNEMLIKRMKECFNKFKKTQFQIFSNHAQQQIQSSNNSTNHENNYDHIISSNHLKISRQKCIIQVGFNIIARFMRRKCSKPFFVNLLSKCKNQKNNL